MKLVDHQFSKYLDALQMHHLLDNAIVVLAADHGEGISGDFESDTLVDAINASSHANKALLKNKMQGAEIVFGHGADIMDKSQYHVPFIVHFYGNHATIAMPQVHQVLNSTVDIAPTLLNLANISGGNFDGSSLVPAMHGVHEKSETVFLNTGIFLALPKNILTLKKFAAYVKNNYYVKPNGAFGMKLEYLSAAKKQFPLSVCWEKYCLDYFPASEDEFTHIKTQELFSLENQQNHALKLFTRPEFEAFLKMPNPGELKKLDISVADIQYMQTQVMNYRQKVLASANSVPPTRVVAGDQ
jgi:hypothetical protein